MKRWQSIMIWLLPVILIDGLFYPLFGYLVLAMIAFFIAFDSLAKSQC